MKKSLRNFGIASLVMALGATAASTAEAGRYYVGGGVGASIAQNLMKTTLAVAGPPTLVYPDNRKYLNRTSIAGGIFGGYLHKVSIFSLGAELGVAVDSEKSKILTSIVKSGVTNSYGFRLARQYTIRATTKFGLNLSDELTVYALLGVANSRFKLSYIDLLEDGSYNSTQSKNLWAFTPGAEVSYRIDNDWSAGVSYTCDVYQPFKSRAFGNSNLTPPDTFQTNVPPMFHTVMARVSYSF